jgi:tRNA(Ile)-lysidine synthase
VLEEAARELGLDWRDDPSNQDVSFDRNWLRRRVLPVVVERWPEAVRSLSRSAALAGEADALLGELAALDLAAAGDDPARLPLMALGELSLPRQRLLIRHACQRLNLPTPPAARLQTLQGQLGARRDARVQVAWSGGEARTWRGALYLLAPLGEVPWGWSDDWDGHPGRMTPVGRVDQGLVPTEETGAVVLRLTLRRGGETLRVAGRGRRDVKRLLQEAGIPPWQRSRQLLVWHEGTLVAVLGVAAAQGWRLTA